MMMGESEFGKIERPPIDRIIIFGMVGFIMGVVVTIAMGAELLAGVVFYSLGFTVLGLALGTKEGRDELRKIWKEAKKRNDQQQQQQQVGGDSEPTRICPDCGWKNPESNNYCNDCGFPFDSGESDE
jgi:membrane protease subunit (stomatin/prohibitin family)